MDKPRFQLKMFTHIGLGATYFSSIAQVPTVWLCNVTTVVFGGAHPREIFVR
jgi:hypothetical protein